MEDSELSSERILFQGARVFDPFTTEWKRRDICTVSGIVKPLNSCHASHTKLVLKGYWVLPGFVDSHCHIVGLGARLRSLDLSRYTDLGTLFADIKSWMAKNGGQDVYIFRGWDEQRLCRTPSKHDIHRWLGPDVKVILVRYCGHVGVLSDILCHELGITNPDGLVSERELNRALDAFPRTKEELERDFLTGAREALKYGITCVHSEDYHRCHLDDLIYLLQNQKEIRIFEKLNLDFQEFLKSRTIFGVLSDFSTVGSLKLYLDGSLGGRTAYLSEPYVDAPIRGKLNLSLGELAKYLSLTRQLSVQVSLHVIGDAALDVTFKSLLQHPQIAKPRLIHLQVTRKDQLEKLKLFDVHLSVQPYFWMADSGMARKRIGNRMEASYAFREMYLRGLKLSFSSDAPVEPIDPRYAIEAAMKQGFSWEEAIFLHTFAASEVSGPYLSKKLGRLKPGYLADFVVYEEDPRRLPKPVAVFVKGREVKIERVLSSSHSQTLKQGGNESVGSS